MDANYLSAVRAGWQISTLMHSEALQAPRDPPASSQEPLCPSAGTSVKETENDFTHQEEPSIEIILSTKTVKTDEGFNVETFSWLHLEA